MTDHAWECLLVIVSNVAICAFMVLAIWLTKTGWPLFGIVALMTWKSDEDKGTTDDK